MATYYARPGTNNWGSTTAWSLTSGGATAGAVPIATDDIIFDANSGNVTVDTTTRSCANINFTGYTGTITMSQNLNVGGNVTLGTGMTIAGTGVLNLVGPGTYTSNGKAWGAPLTVSSNTGTRTFSGTWTVTNFTFAVAAVLNGGTINVTGNLTLSATGGIGTTAIVYTGTGTWSGNFALRNPLTINTAGTLTVSGSVAFNSATLTYIAGTVVTTGSTLIVANTSTLDTNGITWNAVSLTGSGITITNNSTLTCSTFGISFSCSINGSNFIVTSAWNTATSSGTINGTAKVVLQSNCTWTHSGTQAVTLNVDINTAGTVTLAGTIRYQTGTLRLVSGSVVAPTSIVFSNSCTIEVAGVAWNNVTLSGGTLTINGLLTVNGTFDVGSSATVTFSGTHGFTAAIFSCTTAGRVVNFASGKTYTVTSSLVLTGTSANFVSLTSTSTGAIFTLQNGATQSVSYANPTWIDSSGGQPIWTSVLATLSNTTNWGKAEGSFSFMM